MATVTLRGNRLDVRERQEIATSCALARERCRVNDGRVGEERDNGFRKLRHSLIHWRIPLRLCMLQRLITIYTLLDTKIRPLASPWPWVCPHIADPRTEFRLN
jgi:hypothetical protein